MDSQLNTTYLERLDVEMLRIIKQEAEKLLEQKHATESIINSKVLGMLQVLFPTFVGILGVIIDRLTKSDSDRLFMFIALLMEGVIFVTCLFFYRSIFVHNIRLAGTRPSKIVSDEMTSQKYGDREMWFLRNRIFCIENDIMITDEALKSKTQDYENGYAFLLQGSVFVIITFSLLYLYLNFVDPSPKYPRMDFVRELVAQ